MVQLLWKSLAVPQKKLNVKLAYDPAVPHLQTQEKRKQMSAPNWHINVHSSIIDNSPKMEITQCPSTHEWINKMWSIHTMKYYLAIKRKEVLTHA